MSKPNKELTKLTKIWYKKLQKSGFEDIETDEDNLKVWSNRWAFDKYVASIPARAKYYELASLFLLEHEFDSELDKTIWTYHSNGISYRNIAKLLKKARVKRVSYTIVYQKIKRLRELLKVKYAIS